MRTKDGDENVVQIHTIPSVCNFEACFFHLTLEYMDFLRPLIF